MGKAAQVPHWEPAEPFGQILKLKGAVLGSAWTAKGRAYAEHNGHQTSFATMDVAKRWVETEAERALKGRAS